VIGLAALVTLNRGCPRRQPFEPAWGPSTAAVARGSRVARASGAGARAAARRVGAPVAGSADAARGPASCVARAAACSRGAATGSASDSGVASDGARPAGAGCAGCRGAASGRPACSGAAGAGAAFARHTTRRLSGPARSAGGRGIGGGRVIGTSHGEERNERKRKQAREHVRQFLTQDLSSCLKTETASFRCQRVGCRCVDPPPAWRKFDCCCARLSLFA
jgi:hypothetical protein